MVKLRMPESFEDAAVIIGGVLGFKQMGELIGRSESAMRAWADQDKDGRPTMQQAVVMDAAVFKKHKGVTPFLSAYISALKKECGNTPANVDDMLSEALDLPDVVGRLLAAVRRAKDIQSDSGKKISHTEYMEIRGLIRDSRRELEEFEAAADQEYEAQ